MISDRTLVLVGLGVALAAAAGYLGEALGYAALAAVVTLLLFVAREVVRALRGENAGRRAEDAADAD